METHLKEEAGGERGGGPGRRPAALRGLGLALAVRAVAGTLFLTGFFAGSALLVALALLIFVGVAVLDAGAGPRPTGEGDRAGVPGPGAGEEPERRAGGDRK